MKTKYDSAKARQVAETLVEMLRPCTTRIEIAGSLRRQKPTVGDIEILYISRFEERQKDFFSNEQIAMSEERIGRMLRDGVLAKRECKGGVTFWGDLNKLAVHVESGIPVDLFRTIEAWWWVSLVVRTGGKENNLWLANNARQHDRSLVAYGEGVRDRKSGKILQAHSEEEVFKLCGCPYREPRFRK